ncbi:hypothetical protein R1flu_027567 [Riccia fluitans]|uniref:Uncharacterized protein n=1 Tax=Riccia fluitans TaxID=41844 RepID=A0ABD1XJ68_9MARC
MQLEQARTPAMYAPPTGIQQIYPGAHSYPLRIIGSPGPQLHTIGQDPAMTSSARMEQMAAPLPDPLSAIRPETQQLPPFQAAPSWNHKGTNKAVEDEGKRVRFAGVTAGKGYNGHQDSEPLRAWQSPNPRVMHSEENRSLPHLSKDRPPELEQDSSSNSDSESASSDSSTDDSSAEEAQLEPQIDGPEGMIVGETEASAPAETGIQTDNVSESDESMDESGEERNDKTLLPEAESTHASIPSTTGVLPLVVAHPTTDTPTEGNRMVNNAIFSPDVMITAKKRGCEDKSGNRRLSIHHANAQSRLFAEEGRETVLPPVSAGPSKNNTGSVRMPADGKGLKAKTTSTASKSLKNSKKKKLKKKSK